MLMPGLTLRLLSVLEAALSFECGDKFTNRGNFFDRVAFEAIRRLPPLWLRHAAAPVNKPATEIVDI